MKAIKLLLLCIGILILFSCKTDKMILKHEPFIINELNSDFIGTWLFVKRIDENGNKLDTIWHSQGYEIADGPVTTFYKDGTYSMQFTPKNTDKGKWYYNPDSKSMTLFLLIDPNTWVGKEVIKFGLAKKYDNGNYYEELQYKIKKITNDTLQYIDYSNRDMTYKKIK
ncbi:MAG: hypothetical protein H6Q16_1011 [Bacteroidetes bacterium]|nr:hypothetical protein [Bacteroidota bacterium]